MNTTLIPTTAAGWSNSDRALSNNGLFASSIGDDYLVLGGLNSTIADTDTIVGIEIVGIYGLQSPIVGPPGTYTYRLEVGVSLDGAAISGTAQLTGELPSGSLTTVTFGGPNDTLGNTWTGADLANASILCRRPPDSLYPGEDNFNTRRVDFAYIVVYHNAAVESPPSGMGGGSGGDNGTGMFGSRKSGKDVEDGLPETLDFSEATIEECPAWGTGLKPPEGWEDIEKRNQFAAYLCRQIDNFDLNMSGKLDRFQLARRVYEDMEVMSSMEFPDDIVPYNLPLIKQRIDTIVGNTASYFADASPTFILEDGDRKAREKVESDFDLCWRTAKLNLTIRDIAKDAAINGRGAFRVYWDERPKGVGWTRNVFGSDEFQYVGLRIETIPLAEIFYGPVTSKQPEDTLIVGHRFYRPRQWVIGQQQRGNYFADVEFVPTSADQIQDFSVDSENASEEPSQPCRLAHGQVIWAGLDGCEEPTVWRFTLDYESQQLLALEPYEYPRHEYFFPAFDTSSGEFWPDNSIASALLELQAVTNDAWTITLVNAKSQGQPSVLGSGFVPESQTQRFGMGKITFVKGDPKLTPLPVTGNTQGSTYIINQAERSADGVARTSNLGAGQQLSGDLTATEVLEVAAGQNASKTDYYSVFLDPMIEAAQFALYLLSENFASFKSFHGSRVLNRTAKPFRFPYNMKPKNVSPKANPRVVGEAIREILGAVKEMGGVVTPLTRNISGDALFTTLLEASDIQVDPEALLEDQTVNEIEDINQSADGGAQAPPIGFPGLQGDQQFDPANIPPELLAALLSGEVGMDAPPPFDPFGGMPIG